MADVPHSEEDGQRKPLSSKEYLDLVTLLQQQVPFHEANACISFCDHIRNSMLCLPFTCAVAWPGTIIFKRA
jgi:hypothetical protein